MSPNVPRSLRRNRRLTPAGHEPVSAGSAPRPTRAPSIRASGRRRRPRDRLTRGRMARVADTAGRVVGMPLGALARWRRGKPMHPRGVVASGVLERGTGHRFGVPWLDEPARDEVVARISRGTGLPAPLPDLLGLAVRIPDGPVDLLLSTSATWPLVRLVPVLRRDAASAYTSLM